jgi:hypothetical protein
VVAADSNADEQAETGVEHLASALARAPADASVDETEETAGGTVEP